jgi:F0F1-type ATP synthase epsilon subunit
VKTFKLVIASCARVVHRGEAVHCRVSTSEGDIGFEAHHEPFLAVLKAGSEIRYTAVPGNEARVEVAGGLLSFTDPVGRGMARILDSN